MISAIINVGQKVDKPWALNIVNHQGEPFQAYLEPGDLLWYESAT